MTMERTAERAGGAGGEIVGLLRRQGISCVMASSEGDLAGVGDSSESKPPLVLIETAYMTALEFGNCARACADAEIPCLALVPRSRVPGVDAALPMTDFIVSPPDPDELVIRARRALGAANAGASAADKHLIKAGGLEIDTSSYEVSLRGERISLRFKEYELLKMLAENPGRVFSRDALLNRIWGYEYFGGTRTVDVHIRRLRSKIHDSEHKFIETVWNVGYRFRDAP